jgi:hypothetical protein
LSKKVHDFFKESGIEAEPTSSYSPPENGHAERANGVLADIRDAQLADAGLSKRYWAESLMHAAYLSNMTSSTGGTSPWEKLKGTKPKVTTLHIWGCTCWVCVPHEQRSKHSLSVKGIMGKSLGYAQPNFKAFRVLRPSGKVRISRDV